MQQPAPARPTEEPAPARPGEAPDAGRPETGPTTTRPGDPAGTGTLEIPGQAPRDVPLIAIQKDEPRVQVGPVSPETGVADILLGSLGLVAIAVIGSLILGALLGGVLVYVKHRLGWGGPDSDADDHISLRS